MEVLYSGSSHCLLSGTDQQQLQLVNINIALQTFVTTDLLRLPHPPTGHLDQLQKYGGTDKLPIVSEKSFP